MSALFVRQNTEIVSPPLLPEIRLHLASESLPLWQKTEDELGATGLPPPFWAFAWAGGQALARFVLDRGVTVVGRSIVDLASGSGIVAIAAALAGAHPVFASDIDQFACEAMRLNCAINDVAVEIAAHDLLAAPPPVCDLILVGDLFYERALAGRTFAWLEEAQAKGTEVLIGDPGRSYLPQDRLVRIAEYEVPVSRDVEDAAVKRTGVWRMRQ